MIFARALWLAGPVVMAGLLHMIVVRRNLWPKLARPIDFGRTFRGQRIFGDNKTWRGVVFMALAPALLGLVQGVWGSFADGHGLAPFDVAMVGVNLHVADGAQAQIVGYVLLNLVLGLGYSLGELPNSFAKRRVGIEPGKTGSWFFFLLDQADSVIAALVLGAIFFPLGWQLVLVGILELTLLHLGINAWLYYGRVRRNL